MPTRSAFYSLICFAVIAATGLSSAQEGNLSLEETMCRLFQGSPAFRAYAAQSRGAAGTYLRTSGAFDVVASSALLGQRTLLPAASGGISEQGYNDLTLQAGLGTHTRANIAIQLNGSLPLVSSIDPLTSTNQPLVGANLTIPLLKLGRSAALGAEERAAGLHSSATAALQQDAESELASRVAQSYWRWVGSYEQLKWARRLEALALDQVKDVDQLIALHGRAAVDRLAFAAAAENATATRLQAEQLMFEQQLLLWETIGLPPPGAHAPPDGELPEMPAAPVDSAIVARRAHALASSRPLLRSMNEEAEAAAVRAEGARIGKRPDLNLVAQATATRVQSANSSSQSATDGSSPSPATTTVGYYGSLALQFSMPLQNRSARGAFEEAQAAHTQAALNRAQRQNAIHVRIDALSSSLATLSRSYQERSKAAQQFRLAYEAERTRFRLGTATAMDVILAEQQYMSASLGTVADRTAFAVTLAQLLHEAGVLNAAVASRDATAVARSLTNSTF